MYSSAETGMPTLNRLYPQSVETGPIERAAADDRLKDELRQTIQELPLAHNGESNVPYNNADVAARIRPRYSERQLDRFERKLDREGTFNVPIIWREVEIDDMPRRMPLVTATEGADHGDMSSMIYLRDQIQVARSYMELATCDPDEGRYAEKADMGRQLILSSLHLMSTPRQLDRFATAIGNPGATPKQHEWPIISFPLGDLEATKPNGWRNNQDSFQMLADLTFDALNRGFISPEDLLESNKKFLSSVVPFMEAVGYPKHESSGTWEEYIANRTSVISVETSLLYKMKTALQGPQAEQLAFLEMGYANHGGQGALPDKLEDMVRAGLTELGGRWPFESPDYDTRDIKYREADAALAYGLMYDIPDLLEKYEIPIAIAGNQPQSAMVLEDLLLEQLDSLMDPETGAMKRYNRDSYLRLDFLLHAVQANLAAVKSRIARVALRNEREPDLEAKDRLRDGVVPKGRQAAWPHPVAQLSAWAARRQMRALSLGQTFAAERYHHLSVTYLNQSSRSITGANHYNIVRQNEVSYGVQKVTPFRMPEAMVSYTDSKGVMIVPSPHTQLNWAAATQGEAFGMCRVAAHAANAHRLGELSVLDSEPVELVA